MGYNGFPDTSAGCQYVEPTIKCSILHCSKQRSSLFLLQSPCQASFLSGGPIVVFHCVPLYRSSDIALPTHPPLCLTRCCKRWLATDLFLSKCYLSTVNPRLICFKKIHTLASTHQEPYRLLQHQYKPIHPINSHASCT